jgi:prephenate dehydrogenase
MASRVFRSPVRGVVIHTACCRPGGHVTVITVTSVAILGLGLIGGSLLRRLGPADDVRGYDPDASTRAAATAAGFQVVTGAEAAVAGADLVLLAAPLPAFPELMSAVAAANPGALVTDVASVKVTPLGMVPPGMRYVGGHPMAGTERSGFEASDAHLFDGATWVLCLEEDTPLADWLAVARLVAGLGCRVVPATAAEHDRAVARISHLPHVLAAALASAASDDLARKLAAGSFRDGTRVAGTRAELTAAMCDSNREALVEALDGALSTLTRARDLLLRDESTLRLFADGHAARQRWIGFGMGGDRLILDPSAADLRASLLELGRAGGHLDEVADRELHAWRPAR